MTIALTQTPVVERARARELGVIIQSTEEALRGAPTRSLRRLARGQRGVTLLEVLIVVAILSLVAAGVGIAAFKYGEKAKIHLAETNGREIRRAVKTWWFEHDSAACPTIEALVADGTLERDGARNDPWGSPWRIECHEEEVTVSSNGGDRTQNTADDIRVPPT